MKMVEQKKMLWLMSLLMLLKTLLATSAILSDPVPLGLESYAIPDSSLTASSTNHPYQAAKHGRLNLAGTAWLAGVLDTNQWFQVDLLDPYRIISVATQGYGRTPGYYEWVTSYKLACSTDGTTFHTVQDIIGDDSIFTGNVDKNTIVTNTLPVPQVCSFVRLMPVTWYKYICLRMEIYGEETDADPTTDPTTASGPTSQIPELSTEGIILTCNATHMIVEIPKILLTGEMSGEDVRFENEDSSDCIGEDKGNDTPGDEFIELTTSLTACGTVMAEIADTETYTNGVINRYVDDNGISRQYVVDIPLTCSYNRSHRVESISYQLTDYTIDEPLDEDGAYTFSFDIYTDGNYDVVVPDYPFNIGLDEELYFAASVLSTDDSLDLSIRSCRATPGTNYDSEPTFEFIQGGCPVDANAEIRELENDNRLGVMLKTLRFVGDDSDLVYIHCDLLVCDDETENSVCDEECPTGSPAIMERKRRDVSSKLKTKRFTRGPLRVVRSAQGQGSVLSKDVSENGASTQQEFTNAFNPWIVAIAALATVVMAMAAMMAVVLRKVNKISAVPAGYKEGSARLLDEQEEI